MQNIGGRRALFHQQEIGSKARGLIYVIISEGEFRSEMAVSATRVNTLCESKKIGR